ncbi:MAG: hypothetical protein AAGM67_14785 [Bacteroidota bacterium]
MNRSLAFASHLPRLTVWASLLLILVLDYLLLEDRLARFGLPELLESGIDWICFVLG